MPSTSSREAKAHPPASHCREIALARIDRDERFRLSYPLQPRRWADIALRLPGIPLLVIDRRGRLVCGHDYVACLRRRGCTRAPAIESRLPEKEALFLAFHWKQALAGLNAFERLLFLKKILPLAQPNEIQRRAPLGFPLDHALVPRMQRLLRPPYKPLLASDRLSVRVSGRLLDLDPADSHAFLALLARMRLNENQQQKIVDLLEEISCREHRSWERILAAPAVQSLLDQEMPQKRIIEALERRRYPRFHRFQEEWRERYEKRFSAHGFKIVPQPFFEKEEVGLTIRCPDIEAALALLSRLQP